MALNIKDLEADRLARELADYTGVSLTAAVSVALRERLDRVRGSAGAASMADELTVIALRCAALPLLDDRPDDVILGYDSSGLPAG